MLQKQRTRPRGFVDMGSEIIYRYRDGIGWAEGQSTA